MRSAVNMLGAAIGLHALGFSALATLVLPPGRGPRIFVVEPVLLPPIADPALAPAAAAEPAPRPRIARPRTVREPAARSPIASVEAIEPARPRIVEPPPPAPVPQPDSDTAVLLATIGSAARNDAGIDGGLGKRDGEAGASRGSSFVRGGARGVAAPPHESRAEPARPLEDYTRLIPRYSGEAIDHDVSSSVALRVEVDEQGLVSGARLLKGAGYGLDEIALDTVKGYQFKPARDAEGRPVRAVFGWRIVWESHWKRLVTTTVAGRPNCRGQGPLNLGEIHPVYIDCDGDAGYFELAPEQR